MILQTIPFLTDEGFDRSTAAGALVLYSIPSGFSKPVWGLMIDRVTPRYLASLSFMFTAVSVILMVVGASAGSVQILTVAYLLFGLAVGGTVPVQEVIWASYFGRAHLGAVRGVAMPFALVLGAGGPLAVSLYFDVVGDYYGAFYALSAFSVLGALVMLLARKPVKPRAPGAPPAPPVAGPPENGGASLRDPAALASGAEAREDGDGVAAGEPERETVAVPSRVPPVITWLVASWRAYRSPEAARSGSTSRLCARSRPTVPAGTRTVRASCRSSGTTGPRGASRRDAGV